MLCNETSRSHLPNIWAPFEAIDSSGVESWWSKCAVFVIRLTIAVDIPDDDFWVQPSEVQGEKTANSATSTGDEDNLPWHVLKTK